MASRYIDVYEIVTGVVDMSTAIICERVTDAFVVGSDGLATHLDGAQPDTKVRKIFEIVRDKIMMVYAVMGHTEITDDVTGEVVLNFPDEIEKRAKAVSGATSVLAFAEVVCLALNQVLRTAKESGRISEYPSEGRFTTVLFAGFFDGIGSQVEVRFAHSDGVLQDPQTEKWLGPYHYGSNKVSQLIAERNPRVPFNSKDIKSAPNEMLRTVEVIKSYIDAYGSPAAREIHPEICNAIGGETQVCIVRPGGIEWVYGPAGGSVSE